VTVVHAPLHATEVSEWGNDDTNRKEIFHSTSEP
jgi:hypothetical protein